MSSWAYFPPNGRIFNYETLYRIWFSDLFKFHPPGLRKRSKSKRFQTSFFCLHMKYDKTQKMSKERFKMGRIVASCGKTLIIIERFPHYRYCSTFKDNTIYRLSRTIFLRRNNYKIRNLTELDQLISTLIIFLKATQLIINTFYAYTVIIESSNFCELVS